MQFVISADHPSLSGHFPGRPIVPGVVLIDRVLDAIEAAHGPLGTLRLPQVKFVQPLLPGEIANIEVEVLRQAQDERQRWKFRVLRGDVLLTAGEIVAA